jgi:nucleotide-binding universal stress UspA family protein
MRAAGPRSSSGPTYGTAGRGAPARWWEKQPDRTRIKEHQVPGQDDSQQPRIVVGVDGSPSALSALRWAIAQARLTGAAVDAVIAWHYPAVAAAGGYGLAPAAIEPDYDFREIAEKTLADAISQVATPGNAVPVHARAVEGRPAQVLLAASARSVLLVVGSRGHGGFAEALLGSVSQHCVQHAACPVVIIRGPGPSAEAR